MKLFHTIKSAVTRRVMQILLPNWVQPRLDSLEQQVQDMQDIVLEVVRLTGGEGWTQTVQNAISQLDDRLDHHHTAIMHHQKAFKALTEQEENIQAEALRPKNTLN